MKALIKIFIQGLQFYFLFFIFYSSLLGIDVLHALEESFKEDYLINFYEYKDKINEEDCCIIEDPLFSDKYKKALELIQKDQSNGLNTLTLEVLKREYDLLNWIFYPTEDFFNYSFREEKLYMHRKKLSMLNFIWNLRLFLSEQEYKKLEGAFHFNLNFSSMYNTYIIKPYYDLYPYNKEGYPIHHRNGIMHNLLNKEDIRSIKLKVGILGNPNIKEFQIYVFLKDWKGDHYIFPLSTLFLKNSSKIVYYEFYDGNSIFKNPIPKSKINELKDYYMVFYENDLKNYYGYTQYKNEKLVYTELILSWFNDDFLNIKQRYDFSGLKELKKKLKPDFYPYFTFDRFAISADKTALNREESIHFIFHWLSLEYLPYLKKSDKELFDFDNDFFSIFKVYAKAIREKFEMDNAKKIFELIKFAFKNGIVLMEDYLKFFNF